MVGSHPRQHRSSLDTHPLLSLQMDSLHSIYLAIHGQARTAFKSAVPVSFPGSPRGTGCFPVETHSCTCVVYLCCPAVALCELGGRLTQHQVSLVPRFPSLPVTAQGL